MNPETEKIQSYTEEQEALLQVLEEEATEILSKLDNELLSTRERWDHSKSNWASQIHHPCKKQLVHWRLDWKEARFIDINGLYRVKEGSELERQIKMDFSRIGYEIDLSQRSFRYDDLLISGKIDGVANLIRTLPGIYSSIRTLPIEVKTVNPHFWDSTKTVLDLKRHPKFWINKIPSQLNIYLHPEMMNLPAGFIVLITFGKRPRILPMLYDPELARADTNKVRSVNEFVAAGEYPDPIPYDPSVCDLCPFNHMCSPIKITNLAELNSESKWKLEDYLLLKQQKKQFDELHKELIGSNKKPGKYHGKNGIIEDIEISSSTQIRKQFNVPKEVKDQYRGEDNEITTTKIERVGKEW